MEKTISPAPPFEQLPPIAREPDIMNPLQEAIDRGVRLLDMNPLELIESIAKTCGSFILALRGLAGMSPETEPQNI